MDVRRRDKVIVRTRQSRCCRVLYRIGTPINSTLHSIIHLHLHPCPLSLTRRRNASGRRDKIALTAEVLLPFGPELASVFRQATQEQSSLQTAPDWKQSQYNLRHLLLLHLQVMASCSSAVKGRDVPATPVVVRAEPTRPLLAFLVGRGRAFFLGL